MIIADSGKKHRQQSDARCPKLPAISSRSYSTYLKTVSVCEEWNVSSVTLR